MNPRSLAIAAALAITPAVHLAQEAAPPAAPSAEIAAPGPDVATVAGKADALGEKVAELESTVNGLKKLKISGYVQSRYGWLETTRYNPKTHSAAEIEKNFVAPEKANFYIRRGRIKTTYDTDLAQAVLQADVTPAGVSIKEGFVTVKLPMGFAIESGLQLFPFGYEVSARSSADLDLLERGQITNKLLKGEYDLGVAVRGQRGPLNFKLGLFNGNGIDAKTGGRDNDQLKDLIGRVGVDLGMVTGGVSGWYGKTIDYSSLTDQAYDRFRAGADVQVYLDLLPIGGTAIKGEYIWGRTAIGAGDAKTVGGGKGAGDDLGVTMSGFYALVSQNVGDRYQVAVRWDSIIPNHALDVDAAGNEANVYRKNELSAAVHAFVGEAWKLTLAYYKPINGKRGPDALADAEADSFIAQAQVKF